jgi:hypothetical protein
MHLALAFYLKRKKNEEKQNKIKGAVTKRLFLVQIDSDGDNKWESILSDNHTNNLQ